MREEKGVEGKTGAVRQIKAEVTMVMVVVVVDDRKDVDKNVTSMA